MLIECCKTYWCCALNVLAAIYNSSERGIPDPEISTLLSVTTELSSHGQLTCKEAPSLTEPIRYVTRGVDVKSTTLRISDDARRNISLCVVEFVLPEKINLRHH